MRFFPALDFQHVVLLLFIGLGALILIYVAFFTLEFLPREKREAREVETYPGGIQASNRPVPLILKIVYLGLAIWAVVYVVRIGIQGPPF